MALPSKHNVTLDLKVDDLTSVVLREKSLKLAVKYLKGSESSTDYVLGVARKFENYLKVCAEDDKQDEEQV